MNFALVAIVLAIGAGAVLAVSTRDDAASAIGLAVALIGSALVSDPLPSPAVLCVRVIAALLVATMIRSAMRNGPRQPSPVGWPSEALLATAGAVAGLGVAVGLAAAAAAGGAGVGVPAGVPGIGEPGAVTGNGGSGAITSMALITAAGTSLLVLGAAPLVHGKPGPRRAIGLVLVTQAVLLLRIGVAGPAVELEEIAREALLVVAGATGAALASAAAGSMLAHEGGDDASERERAGEGRRSILGR